MYLSDENNTSGDLLNAAWPTHSIERFHTVKLKGARKLKTANGYGGHSRE